MQEYKGVIQKLFDLESGIIKGEDGNEYYFSKANFKNNKDIKEGDSVIFGIVTIETVNGYSIHKAIDIQKI